MGCCFSGTSSDATPEHEALMEISAEQMAGVYDAGMLGMGATVEFTHDGRCVLRYNGLESVGAVFRIYGNKIDMELAGRRTTGTWLPGPPAVLKVSGSKYTRRE